MNPGDLNQRLSKIETSWTVLDKAHSGSAAEVGAAQKLLLERYGRAVHRYLLAAVRDPHQADELTQEFALALLRGEFRHATPQRGRFRGYIKSVLFHLVSRFRKKEQKLPAPLAGDSDELSSLAAEPEGTDGQFDATWRDELLGRALAALAREQPTFAVVLRFRTEHPTLTSAQMAEQLSRQLGQSLTADGVRQTLRRARDKFAVLLVDEVAQTLEAPTADQIAEELGELGLLEYCRSALDQRSGTV